MITPSQMVSIPIISNGTVNENGLNPIILLNQHGRSRMSQEESDYAHHRSLIEPNLANQFHRNSNRLSIQNDRVRNRDEELTNLRGDQQSQHARRATIRSRNLFSSLQTRMLPNVTEGARFSR
jgi:hypothetical protein